MMADLEDLDATHLALAGGKAASLGELSRLAGVHVPPGFCVGTDAFKQARPMALLDRLAEAPDPALVARIREAIEAAPIPVEVAQAIRARVKPSQAYAVRSSATAEDLPTASFAGQQDTYLNVVGADAVLAHVSRCWASLFTDRAVAYRAQHGFDHRQVAIAVVVQEMVSPRAAGVLFTADPLTSNRRVAAIEATAGLGEALASGHVNADRYRVRDGQLLEAHGTLLTPDQAVALAALGRRIEAHFGCPQDVEWCLADGRFWVVQSRPITTLFPIPAAPDDAYHVYLSVGHQQMMTDALKPLGLSVYQLTSIGPRYAAAGRLFVDVTPMLAAPGSRQSLLAMMGQHDPLTKDAVETILEHAEIPPKPDVARPAVARPEGAIDVAALIAETRASIDALEERIQSQSGPALFDFIRDDIQVLKRQLTDPRSSAAIWGVAGATSWLDEHMSEWLGEKGVSATLSRSVPDNVTSDMGLALMEVADAIRPHPEDVERLRQGAPLEALGPAARGAIEGFLARYGMRCPGEIDLTRPRWSEAPTALYPSILANLQHFEPGAAARKFEEGRREAVEKEQDLLARLKALPDGERKAAETKEKIDQLRALAGFREFPKYGMVSRYALYRQAILRETAAFGEDAYYLTFDELQEAVRVGHLDPALVARRKEEHRRDERLAPPRVITSDGEIASGSYRREDLPPGALVGLPVSAGVVEGRARVVLAFDDAALEAGDILVTPFTDPSWTPLFVSIGGLVTEVGSMMTHGAVIAREYGLPAVVSVDHATRLIKDGQRIRLNGTEGTIELL